MKSSRIARVREPSTTNELRRGSTYRATTRNRTVTGEYLGMESPHGDRSILLRSAAGTASISLCNLTSLRQAIG